VKRGKKKKRAKEKKTVELLKLFPKHILTKQTNFLHSTEFCCILPRFSTSLAPFNQKGGVFIGRRKYGSEGKCSQ